MKLILYNFYLEFQNPKGCEGHNILKICSFATDIPMPISKIITVD